MREVGGHLVESHGVGTVQAEVVGVLVVRQRTRHLGLLVDHLSGPGEAVVKRDLPREARTKSTFLVDLESI